MGMMSPQKQADLLKDKGNLYFKREKLGAAIDAYTEAITLCPSVPVYWTNRALCERKRNEWQKVESDCRRALELDSHSVKAYYMLGLALLQYQQYEEAVKQLEKALDLGRGAPGNYMVEEIWNELAKAKCAEWEAVVEVRQRQQQDLKFHLLQLLREDYERQLNNATVSIKYVASTSQHPPQQEARLVHKDNDGSRQGGGSPGTNKKTHTSERNKFLPVYSDVEFERLDCTSGQPLCETTPECQGNDEKGFHTLIQQQLPLRGGNSTCIRLQMNQGVLDCVEEQSASPDVGGSEPEIGVAKPASAATTAPETISEPASAATTTPETISERAGSASVASQIESGGTASEVASTTVLQAEGEPPTSFHSIHDVFKAFKEFMKLKRHDAVRNLLEVNEVYQRRSTVLEDVFERVTASDRQTEVPDHLCCKITMDIFRDPVITPSGITYERAALLDHLKKVGKFDPFTRAPLTVVQIVPNLALKEAVQTFLEKHGWAYESCQ